MPHICAALGVTEDPEKDLNLLPGKNTPPSPTLAVFFVFSQQNTSSE